MLKFRLKIFLNLYYTFSLNFFSFNLQIKFIGRQGNSTFTSTKQSSGVNELLIHVVKCDVLLYKLKW